MRTLSIYGLLIYTLIAVLIGTGIKVDASAEAALSATDETRWGGQGYDSAVDKSQSSLFVASTNYSKGTIEIQIDHKKTATVDLISMSLKSEKTTNPIQARGCWKKMRHESAPWICSFSRDEIKRLGPKGSLVVKNKDGSQLFTAQFDLSKLKSLQWKN